MPGDLDPEVDQLMAEILADVERLNSLPQLPMAASEEISEPLQKLLPLLMPIRILTPNPGDKTDQVLGILEKNDMLKTWVSQDCIPVLVKQLQPGRNVGKANAAEALCKLASLPFFRDEIGATKECISNLLLQLMSGNDTDKLSALGCLVSLLKNESFCSKLGPVEDCIRDVVPLLGHSNEPLATRAFLFIYCLSKHFSLPFQIDVPAHYLVSLGFRLIYPDVDFQDDAARNLELLSRVERFRLQIGQTEPCISNLVALLIPSSDSDVPALAAAALGNLAWNPLLRGKIGKIEGCIDAVRELLKSGNLLRKKAALCTLETLAVEGAFRKSIAGDQAFINGLVALRKSEDTYIKNAARNLLFYLAKDTDIKRMIKTAKDVEKAPHLLGSFFSSFRELLLRRGYDTFQNPAPKDT